MTSLKMLNWLNKTTTKFLIQKLIRFIALTLLINIPLSSLFANASLSATVTITSPNNNSSFKCIPELQINDQIVFKWSLCNIGSDNHVYYRFDNGNWIRTIQTSLTKNAGDFLGGTHKFDVKVTSNLLGENVVVSTDTVTFAILYSSDLYVKLIYLNENDFVSFTPNGQFTIKIGLSDYLDVWIDGKFFHRYVEGQQYTAGTTFNIYVPKTALKKGSYDSPVYTLHSITVKNYYTGQMVDSEKKHFYVHWNYADLYVKVIAIGPNTKCDGSYNYYLISDLDTISETITLQSVNGIYKGSKLPFIQFYHYHRNDIVKIELHGPKLVKLFWVFYKLIPDAVIAEADIKVSPTITSDLITDSSPYEQYVYSSNNLDGFLKLEGPSWSATYAWGFNYDSWRIQGATMWIAIELTNLQL